MAGIKSFMLPVLFMIMGGAGVYIYQEMNEVSAQEIDTVETSPQTSRRQTAAGGNTRGNDRRFAPAVAKMRPAYEKSCKEKNAFVTKKLGDGYPESWPLMDILKNWSPDDPTRTPDKLYQSMKHFDYAKDLEEATKYREAEVPFVIKNIPALNNARAKWQWEWLTRKIGATAGRVELPTGTEGDGAFGNNHLMFWRSGGADPPGYKQPTSHGRWDFNKWFKEASKSPLSNDDPHYYYHLWGKRNGEGPWIYKTLGADNEGDSFAKKKSFFVPDPSKNRGILCRFGMEGTIAETHFDMNRNMVSVVRGRKRYIMMAPNECENVYFFNNAHPSRRHSMVDFSQPGKMDFEKFPKMKTARAFEVILEEGDVLYIPSFWMHYIVGLGKNLQCNTRSGMLSNDPWHQKVMPCLA